MFPRLLQLYRKSQSPSLVSGGLFAIICVLILVTDATGSVAAAAAGALPRCRAAAGGGVIAEDCQWQMQQPLARSGGATTTTLYSPSPDVHSVVLLTDSTSKQAQAAASQASLSLERLIIVGSDLDAVTPGELPLWPLGMFEAMGSSIKLADVRLAVTADSLAKLVSQVKQLPPADIEYHTVRTAAGRCLWFCGFC